MRAKRWMKRMVILDLLLLGLLLFGHIRDGKETVTVGNGEVPAERVTKGRTALTFDDGPDPRYTEKLLDGLKERDVKATFFVTGINVSKYPEIIKRMQEEGHLIGNHTYHHV